MAECIIDQILRVVFFFRLHDYLLCLVCGLVAFGVSKARPHCRLFSWADSTIDFPYGGTGAFPSWTLPLIAVLPGVAYVICEAIRHLWWIPQCAPSSSSSSSVYELRQPPQPSYEHDHRSANQGAGEGEQRIQIKEMSEPRVQVIASPPRPSSSSPTPFLPQEQQLQQNQTNEEIFVEVEPVVGTKKHSQASLATVCEMPEDVQENAETTGRADIPAVQLGWLKSKNTMTSIAILETMPGVKSRTVPSQRPPLSGQFQRPDSPSRQPYDVSNNPISLSNNNNNSRGRGVTNAQNSLSLPLLALSSSSRHREDGAASKFNAPLRAPWQRFLTHAHTWVLTQAFAVTLAMLVTDSIKVYAGRLRPDFLSRLRREGYSEASVDVDWCKVGRKGRVSFPSGHSSISFAAFVPFCFYVMHTLRVFSRDGVPLWRVVVGLNPLILPFTVAVSRTRDNRHNFDDAMADSLIGIASALIAIGAKLTVNRRTGQLMPRLPLREQWLVSRITLSPFSSLLLWCFVPFHLCVNFPAVHRVVLCKRLTCLFF